MDLDEFAVRVRATAGALSGPQMEKVMDSFGVAVKKDAAAAVRSDLGGDLRFSGWRTDDLAVRYNHVGPGAIIVSPTPRTIGPWVVAELGRHQGNARGHQGPGVNRTTGVTARTKAGGLRKVRATQGKRWNGTTRGKRTFSDFVDVSDRQMAKRIQPLVVDLLRDQMGV